MQMLQLPGNNLGEVHSGSLQACVCVCITSRQNVLYITFKHYIFCLNSSSLNLFFFLILFICCVITFPTTPELPICYTTRRLGVSLQVRPADAGYSLQRQGWVCGPGLNLPAGWVLSSWSATVFGLLHSTSVDNWMEDSQVPVWADRRRQDGVGGGGGEEDEPGNHQLNNNRM